MLMRIDRIFSPEVVTAPRDTTVVEAARLMRRHHVGDVVVVEDRGGRRVPCGIVTDRDIAIAVVAEGIDPYEVSVGEVIQGELVTGDSGASVAEIVELMERHGVRRIPIVDQRGELVGIVTADDLVEGVAHELAAAANILEQSTGERRPEETFALATGVDVLRNMAHRTTALARMLSKEQRKELDLRRSR